MTPTRILVVGGGGREHALAWKLRAEPGINDIHVAPGSAGIATEPGVTVHPDVGALDGDGLSTLAREAAIELAVIGPEAPLAAGIADRLREAGVPTFGPSKAAARIETSKAFCREVAASAGIPMAEGRAFADHGPALTFAQDLAAARGGSAGVVIKADGLAAGKGVTVCASAAEAEAALATIFEDAARDPGQRDRGDGTRVVVEERLVGREVSVIALCDGRDVVGLTPARDHKRLHDGDLGPNTGGMGAYSPVPDLPIELAEILLEDVHRPILAELARRGSPFRGALYAGLILTEAGPRLLECNARFGDPETQVVLPLVGVAIAPVLLAAAQGALGPALSRLGLRDGLLPTLDRAAVGIVLAAAGYPERPRTGERIDGLEQAAADGTLVFHAGTVARDDGGFSTAGGRIVTVVGRGASLSDARIRAEAAADRVSFPGLQRRRDIAADLPGGPAGAADPIRGDRRATGPEPAEATLS